MKGINEILLAAALAVVLAVPAFADVISPGEALIHGVERNLSTILLVVVLVITAILVRKFTKRK